MAGHMEVTFEQKALGMVIGCRERDKRAVVVTIRKGGAAESLGVLPGMLIASVDGSAMTSFDEARAPRPVELGKWRARCRGLGQPWSSN